MSAAGLEAASAGPGGLVAVVGPALACAGGSWLFAPSSAEEREIAASGLTWKEGGVTYKPLYLSEQSQDAAYRSVYTELLVPLFHHLLSLDSEPTFDEHLHEEWDHYRQVNDSYGAAIAAHAGGGVLVEDAHLMLAAAAARKRDGGGAAALVYFHHMPWCEPEYFGVLPRRIRDEVLAALLSFDSVGFHSARWAEAFTSCCERFLGAVREAPGRLGWRGRSTAVVATPAAIDVDLLARRAAAPPCAAWQERFRRECAGRRAIVRVERLDPAKNPVRSLQAYEQLLDRRPDLRGSTCLLGVMTPVREWVPAYRRCREATEREAARMNERFAALGIERAPVRLFLAEDPHAFDHHRALAALSIADVTFATPVWDGLNIVPLEAAAVGESSIVLSCNAGAYEHIAGYVHQANPFDTVDMAAALAAALDEPAAERQRRALALRTALSARSPQDWVRERLTGAGRRPFD
jgi:trehalose 6-phosphate synthase